MRVAIVSQRRVESCRLLCATPLVLAAALSLALAKTAQAADNQVPFSFAEQTPLVASCSDLVDDVEVVVRNETAEEQTLHVSIGRVTDSDGNRHDAQSVCGGLSVEISEPGASDDGQDATRRVKPGADAVLKLHATANPTNGKTYTSTLAIYADGGVVARRTLTINQEMSQAANATDGVAAVPLVDSRDVAHHDFDPFDDWVVWLPIALPESQAPALTPGDTVGAVSGERGTAAVTYGEEARKRLSATTSLVPLHIQKVGAGKYSGEVDLTPDDTETTETGVVSLSLTASHWWPLALLPVVGGILIAVGVQWRNGARVTKARLLQRVAETTTLREQAQQRLQAAAKAGQPDDADGAKWGDFDLDDLVALQKDLRDEIDRRTAHREVAIDQKIVDDLGAKIDALESKIGVLDTIAKTAPLLVSALETLTDERPNLLPPLYGSDLDRDAPRLEDTAKGLLIGYSLPAADLVERASEIAAMVTVVRALQSAELALSHYWGLALELECKLADDEKPKVSALKSLLEGIRHALWDADSAKVVDDAVDEFEEVREKVDELWPKIPEPRPRPLPHASFLRATSPLLDERMLIQPTGVRARLLESPMLRRALEGDHAIVLDDLLDAGGGRAVVRPLPPGGAPPSPPPRVTQPRPLTEAEADRLIKAARRTQWLGLAISIAVAVITGLSVLYIGKPWGTPWDYVFALSWGLATQAVIATIAGAIGGLGALGALRQGLGRPREPALR